MPKRLLVVSLFTATFILSHSTLAQTDYVVPRTEHGQPDFQGVWSAAFLTMVERPAGIDYLIATPEQAADLAAAIISEYPEVDDPEIAWWGLDQLARVRGEYRTSIIVKPDNGQMPFNELGAGVSAQALVDGENNFDHPEQRPRSERCLEGLAMVPMRTIPVLLAHAIVQTADHVAIISDEQTPLRIIQLRPSRSQAITLAAEGNSTGRWEADTLVVETTHFRDDDPTRGIFGRPILISRDAVVEERFTRVSETELLYQYTVNDTKFYTESWQGEFSFSLDPGTIYEYGCHEGNYSLPGILRGGQYEAARLAEESAARN